MPDSEGVHSVFRPYLVSPGWDLLSLHLTHSGLRRKRLSKVPGRCTGAALPVMEQIPQDERARRRHRRWRWFENEKKRLGRIASKNTKR